MANYNCGEKQSIKDSVKFLKRYGSTCNHLKRPEYYITHIVQKTDTLPGLALKYNTTTEEIRRINRLFACDSLFLRGQLKIPVNKEAANSFDSDFCSAANFDLNPSASANNFHDKDENSVNDLFCKIDNSIASTRIFVKQVQEQSSIHTGSGVGEILSKYNCTKQPHPLYSASCSSTSSNDVFATPHPVVLNQGRKVKTSLQRLEKEQDELFEL